MKMKILNALTLAALFAAAPAFALDGPENMEKAKAIRLASVEVKVRQVYLADRDLLEKSEEVCDIGGEYPVYGPVADERKVLRQDGLLVCRATIGGRPVQIQVSGAVLYDNAKGKDGAKKTVRGVVFVSYLDENSLFSAQPFRFSTTDLKTKNFDLFVSNASFDLPEIKQGTPSFTAFVTVTDLRQ